MIRRRSVYISIAITAIDASFMEHTRMHVSHVARRTYVPCRRRVSSHRDEDYDKPRYVDKIIVCRCSDKPDGNYFCEETASSRKRRENPIRSIQRANCVSRFATRAYIVRT